MINHSDIAGIRGDFYRYVRDRYQATNVRLKFIKRMKAADRCTLILRCLRALRRGRVLKRRDYQMLVLVALNDKKRREDRRVLPVC